MAVNSTGSSSTSSFYNALGIKNTGIGGLVSGLETDKLVEALTAGTRAKIAKQSQNRQLLSWKMTAYRSMASSLRAYQDKYLKFSGVSTGATNLSSSTFFNTVKMNSSSSKVTIQAGSAIGNYEIERVQQLAAAETVTNLKSLGGDLAGSAVFGFAPKAAGAYAGKSVNVTLGGETVNIDLSGLDGITDKNAFSAKLQNLVDTAFDSAGMIVDVTAESGGYFSLKYWADISNPNAVETFNLMPAASSFAGQTMQVSVDGNTKTIDLDSLKNAKSPEELKNELQKLMNDAFGQKTVEGVKKPIVAVTLDGGKIKLDSDSAKISVSENAALGFTAGQSNRVSTNTKLGSLSGLTLQGDTFKFSINGVEFNFSGDDTLATVIDTISNSTAGVKVNYSSLDGKLTVTSKTTGAGSNIAMSDTTGNLIGELFGAKLNGSGARNANWAEGKNAEIVVDGLVLTSATNTFSFNGVIVEVNDVTKPDDEPVKLSVTSDPDTLVAQIKDWINDYNALLITLNTAINEEKDSAYPPLTDEQKADMTEDQIKKWEAEAKKGILRGDSTLRSIASDFRTSLFKKVEAAGISLYDLGIATKSYESGGTNPINAGTIELTEAGEKKLRAMIETSPSKVQLLFTGDDGLTARMNTIVDRAAKTSSINRGTLVAIAGTEFNTGDNTSSLSKKIDDIDKYVTALKTRLESEYNRHWKKFTALETALQKMNMQSSWLSSWGS